jgi:pimeloyl-ACP methyl ester carboxylesterase
MLKRLAPMMVALLFAVTACTQSDASTPAEPEPTAGAAGLGCPDLAAGGRAVSFGAGKARNLAGVVLGDGPTGVILVHQSNGSACQWLPYAKVLATQGYRAFAIEVNGSGSSIPSEQRMDDEVVAATAYLRAAGVRSVVLVGASMGGTAVLGAAAKTSPKVDGVVSLSAPASFADVDATAAVGGLTVPALFICGAYDAPFADAARAFYAAAPPETKPQLIIPADSGHGVALVDPDSGNDAARISLATFLKAHSAT